MANRAPTLLATAMAAAFSLSAHANGPTQADYAKVVLYSNVTIAQDSASQWGIWEELEPTAAGPQTPQPLLAGRSEPYRPLGTVTPVAPVTPTTPQPPTAVDCSAGNLCGFGVIYLSQSFDESARAQALSEGDAPDRLSFKLVPSEIVAGTGSSWLPESFNLTTEGVRGDVPAFSAYGPMTYNGGSSHYREFMNDSETVMEFGNIDTQLGRVNEELGPDTTIDHFEGNLSRYVRGSSQSSESNGQSVRIYGVWGVTTPAADMAALMRGNVVATYTGYAIDDGNARSGSARFVVNFGTQTFTGSFNGGVDGPGVRVQTTASGATQLQGAVGFNLEGRISGSNWSATSFSARDASSISGVASGAFFGPQAAAMGGVVDVTKTLRISSPEEIPYTNGRYVAPFVAVKQDNTPR